MESTPASTKTALTRVVLHLDLEEDVDNGVGLFNLGVLERIVWFKVCASAFAGYTFFPAHSSPRVHSLWRKFGPRSSNSKGTK